MACRPVFFLLGASAGFVATVGTVWGDSFRVPNTDCLVSECHGAGAAAPNLVVSDQFSGIAGLANASIRSQHNVLYASDGNLATLESAAQIECKKCHDTGDFHVYASTGNWLHYPDAITYQGTPHTAGEAVARAGSPLYYEAYQGFCISCHDGVRVTADPNYPESMQRLQGPIPSTVDGNGIPQQVGPTNPANPSAQQIGTLSVPPQPPKDGNAGAPFVTPTPYFNYYEANGHGRATGEATASTPLPMNVTCLVPAGAGPQGCHTPHGSASRFLIDDSYTASLTPSDVARNLCLECHTTLGNPTVGQAYMNFHTMAEHFSITTGSIPYRTNPNIVVGHGTQISALLPYYGGMAVPVESRVYFSGGAIPVLGTHAANCVTCHDAHGTSSAYVHTPNFNEDGLNATANTRGMLRKFPTLWFGTAGTRLYQNDPFCGECHLP